MGCDSRKDGLWRDTLGQALNTHHTFPLAKEPVSWIVYVQNLALLPRDRNSKFLVNEWYFDLLGLLSQYPEVPDPYQSSGRNSDSRLNLGIEDLLINSRLSGLITIYSLADCSLCN